MARMDQRPDPTPKHPDPTPKQPEGVRDNENVTPPDDFKVLDFGRIIKVMGIALGALLVLLVVLLVIAKALGRF